MREECNYYAIATFQLKILPVGLRLKSITTTHSFFELNLEWGSRFENNKTKNRLHIQVWKVLDCKRDEQNTVAFQLLLLIIVFVEHFHRATEFNDLYLLRNAWPLTIYIQLNMKVCICILCDFMTFADALSLRICVPFYLFFLSIAFAGVLNFKYNICTNIEYGNIVGRYELFTATNIFFISAYFMFLETINFAWDASFISMKWKKLVFKMEEGVQNEEKDYYFYFFEIAGLWQKAKLKWRQIKLLKKKQYFVI